MIKRILAMLLAVVMVIGMIPVIASAEAAVPTLNSMSLTLNSVLDFNVKVNPNGSSMTGYKVKVTIGSDEHTVTDYSMNGSLYVYKVKLPVHRISVLCNGLHCTFSTSKESAK